MDSNSYENLISALQGLSILDTSDTAKSKSHKRRIRRQSKKHAISYVTSSVKILKDPTILNICRQNFSTNNTNAAIYVNEALTYFHLDKKLKEFICIKNYFRKQKLIVKSVKKVFNPYIKLAFELKRKFHYNNCAPQLLFHGTKEQYVDSICTYNFNWRLSGSERGHRYGKGINFAKAPMFASFFGDKRKLGVIIITDVLVEYIAPGNENLELPPEGSDTTTGKKRTIFVKFIDNEFCPTHVVQFVKMYV